MYAANGSKLPRRLLRAVWAAVTHSPQAYCIDIAVDLGVSKSKVHYALRALRAAGYIAFEDRSIGARQILVPFVVTKKAGR